MSIDIKVVKCHVHVVVFLEVKISGFKPAILIFCTQKKIYLFIVIER